MTFLDFFDLKNNPFDAASDSAHFALDSSRENICQLIMHDLIDEYYPIVLTGEVGSGKSQVLQRLATLLPHDFLLITPFVSCMNYLDRVEMTVDSLSTPDDRSKKIVLAVENAQDIPNKELNLLLTFPQLKKYADRTLLMIWTGTPELDAKLSLINATKFNDLYPNHYRLSGLSEVDIRHHIDTYLHRANYPSATRGELFSAIAINEIARLSRGLPGLINQLCHNSLTLAFLDDQPQVSETQVVEAYLLSFLPPEKGQRRGEHSNLITPQNYLKISNKKFTLKYLKRLFRYYWLQIMSRSLPVIDNNASILPDLFEQHGKLLMGGAVTACLGLVTLFSILHSDKHQIGPNTAPNVDALIESLPATSAGPAADASRTDTALKPSAENPDSKQTLTKITSKTYQQQLPAGAASVNEQHAEPTPLPHNDRTSPPTTASTLTGNAFATAAPKTEPVEGIAAKSLSQSTPIQSLKQQHVYRRAPVHTGHAQTTAPKMPSNDKPKYVLKPLDAPGDWDEIVILDDPNSPTSNATPGVENAATAVSVKAQGRKQPGVSKRNPKSNYVLKPLDAPGKWDDIVIVDDPASAVTSKAGTQTESAHHKSEEELKLDKSGYEYVDQIIIVDDQKAAVKAKRRHHRRHR